MRKLEKVSICFVQCFTFSLEHFRTNGKIPKIVTHKRHYLVNCLMFWEGINSRPIETILFFKVFGKIGNFAVLICCAELVPATCKNKIQFTCLFFN